MGRMILCIAPLNGSPQLGKEFLDFRLVLARLIALPVMLKKWDTDFRIVYRVSNFLLNIRRIQSILVFFAYLYLPQEANKMRALMNGAFQVVIEMTPSIIGLAHIKKIIHPISPKPITQHYRLERTDDAPIGDK